MTVDWALWRACEKPMPGFGAALEPRFWAAIGELRVVFGLAERQEPAPRQDRGRGRGGGDDDDERRA
jgi:hypothetical protein